MRKILINIVLLIALVLLAVNADAFQFIFKNETGEVTQYFLWYEPVPKDIDKLVFLADGLLEVGEVVTLDFPELVRPGVYTLMWMVRYPTGFGEPWIRFWLYENAIAMEVRLVIGGFHPDDIIKVTTATPL